MLKRAGSPDRLVLTEVPSPVPESNEVLVRIYATSVTRGDVVMRKMPRLVARIFGETPKSIPGYEFAGEVEAIGDDVGEFKIGDRVFGTTSGLSQGSYAEYLCVLEDGMVALLPSNVGYEEAAPIPVGAMTALHFLQAGDVGPEKRVLINGASGSVGSYAVQIARKMDAYVTGVASASNTELVASLGADEVIDYTKQDFTEGTEKYDVIFDAAGKTTATKAEGVLRSTAGSSPPVLGDESKPRNCAPSGTWSPVEPSRPYWTGRSPSTRLGRLTDTWKKATSRATLSWSWRTVEEMVPQATGRQERAHAVSICRETKRSAAGSRCRGGRGL